MNLELISYKDYPLDQYTKAICTIRIDNKHVVAYAMKLTKSGGVFWSSASHSVTENGSKMFINGYMPDSRGDETIILEFVKQQSRKFQPSSFSEVAESQGLPF